MALTDRSFEEVCAVMDRTGDVVELLVEHGADLRMCDLLDEPMPASQRKNSGYNMQGLTLGKSNTLILLQKTSPYLLNVRLR